MANNTGKKPAQQNKKGRAGNSRNNGADTRAKKPAQDKDTNEQKSRLDRQKKAVLLMAGAVFLLFVALVEGESVWNYLHNFVFSIFGFCAYLIPFLIAYIAVVYAKDKPLGSISANIISSSGLIVFISASVHLLGHGKEFFADKANNLSSQIINEWNGGSESSSGVIGALVGGGIAKLFGRTPAILTVFLFLFVFILLVTGTTLPLLASYIKKPVKKVGEATNVRIEQGMKKMEEIKEQREKESEERKASQPPELKESPKAKTAPSIGPVAKKKTLDEPSMPEMNDNGVIASVPGVPAAVDGNPNSIIPVFTPVPEQKPDATETKAKEPAPEEKQAQKTSVKKPAKTEKKPVAAEEKQPEKDNVVKLFGEPPAPVKGEYIFPSIECLKKRESTGFATDKEEESKGALKLTETLESFKIKAEVTNIVRGPSVTRFELVPDAGVRINRITSLADDIALRLAAESVRIEAPIPGKSAIGIEVPNKTKSMVSMREIIETDQFRAGSLKSKLNVALGKDITGNIITADLAKMPHLLVAGTTGSGKSVCLNSMIISILYNASPDEVKLLMIDPKQVEFTVYNGIAHLAVPVVSNPRKAAGALSWAVSEMEKRYAQFAANGVRDIKGFNKLVDTKSDAGTDGLVKMHHIVIFIDELSDLMMASPKEVEDSICRLAQMARAAGIHLVIATQRPSVDVITGIIKANIPSRIALYVSSQTDSRTILDQGGAEKLLGNGDMLFSPVGSPKPVRVQGCFIDDEEVETVVAHIKQQSTAVYDDSIMKEIEAKAAAADGGKGGSGDEGEADDLDPMFDQAAEAVVTAGQASTTMLQKKLKLGYARASRVMDQLEENGIVGPAQGAKPREVLVSKQDWYERQALSSGSASADRNEQYSFDTLPSMTEAQSVSEDELEDNYDENPDEPDTYDEYEEDYDSDESSDDDESYDGMEDNPEDITEETYYEKDEYSEPVEFEEFSDYTEEFNDNTSADDLDEDDNPLTFDDLIEDDEADDDDEDFDDFFGKE